MRRSFAFTLILVLISTVCFAAFTPTMLKFTAPSSIQYGFDGSDLAFTFGQSGTTATTVFSVFTKGQAGNITDIRNGRMGWHYVNMIDTCVYVGNTTTFGTGTNTITWNGRNADGNLVAEGDYTYYLWGYDSASVKVSACQAMNVSWFQNTRFITRDEMGQKLAKPLMMGSDMTGYYGGIADSTGNITKPIRFMKWNLGDAPEDTSLVQGTFCTMYVGGMNFGINPADYNIFYPQEYTFTASGLMRVAKRTWVPNAEAEMDLAWGLEDGYYSKLTTTGDDSNSGGTHTISDTELVMMYGCSNHTCMEDGLQYIDMETGTELRYEDMQDTFTWFNNFPTRLKWQNRVPTNGALVNGRFTLFEGYATPVCCVNPQGSVADGDFWLWKNLVGDGFHDNYDDNPNFTAEGRTADYSYWGTSDSNWHNMQTAYDVGAVSFSLSLADGTGIGYLAYQGDVGGWKAAMNVVDDDTSYDGLYMDNSGSGTGTPGWMYIAQDSITGTITKGVGVEETAPAAYSVAQNTPNPFNPTTTINFNIAKAGKVTVDIYNVAGQKVDTLVNGNQSAGSHSVVWNASKFSAGVYFYTVKSGSFSKTMKMTLVK